MRTATFDIETDKLMPETTKIWCACVKDHDSGETQSFTPDTVHELPSLLATYDCLIGHNCIDFDFAVLRKIFQWSFTGQIIDTLLMSRVQRPNRVRPPGAPRNAGPHSVQAWGYRVGRGKVEYEQWDKYTPEMLRRCQEDVEIQYLIYQALLKEGEGEGWEHAHKLNSKLFQLLKLQEENGWYIDQDHLGKSLHFLSHWIERIDRAITPQLPLICEPKETKKDGKYGYVKKPFNKNGQLSNASNRIFNNNPDWIAGCFSRVSFRRVDLDKNSEVKQFLLNLGWEPDEWNTNNAGKRTSPKLSKDDDFSGIQGSLGRLVARRVQCKQRRGILEGWRNSIRPDGRISPKVSEFATTGRIKHSVVVNVPSEESGAFFGRWMRKCFAATPGWKMCGVDSKGNQIRQLAARMNDDEFTKSVLYGTKEAGTDLHSINQRRAGTSTRTTAKNFFYGLIFGASNKKLRTYGTATREQFLNQMPKFKELLDNASEEWRATAERVWNGRFKRWEFRNGFVTGLDGRPIMVDSEHKLLNFLLQSDEAIHMTSSYCVFHKWMEKRGYVLGRDWRMLIFYHDEFQFEFDPEVIDEGEVMSLAEESIAWSGRYYKISVPHEGEARIGYSWSATH